jgi:hypothetical protein
MFQDRKFGIRPLITLVEKTVVLKMTELQTEIWQF